MAQKQDPKRMAVLLGVLGVIVVAVLVYSLVLSGGDDDAATTTTGADGGASTTIDGDTTTDDDGDDDTTTDDDDGDDVDLDDDETFDVFATKNPFEPVVSPISPGGGNDGTTPTTGIDGGTTTTTPGDSGVPTTTPGGTGTTPTVPFTGGGTGTGTGGVTPSVDPVAPQPVALLDVFVAGGGVRQARVRVGSTVYTVGVGDVFATSYRVVALSDSCGQFLFGDDPFELCEGEEVVK